MAQMQHRVAVELGDRLASDTSLSLPTSMHRTAGGAPDQTTTRQYLVNLLERDSGVFLERYTSTPL